MKHVGVITGATGYIGSHLLRYLLKQEWEIHIIAQPEFGYSNIEDVKDQIHIIEYEYNINDLALFFQRVNPEVVFHLASAVITNYKPEQIPCLIQSNIQFGTEVLEAMKTSQTRLFINTGSYWQNYNSDIYNPVDLYAATKEAFEKMLQFYVDAYDYRVITLRLFDVYGEDDKRPKLLNILKSIAGTDKSLDVSPGEQLLDMVHISDVCHAFLKTFENLEEDKSLKNEVWGVYTGDQLKLKSIAALFEKTIGKKICVNWGKKCYKKREIMKPIESYQKVPGWNAEINIGMGLARLSDKDLI